MDIRRKQRAKLNRKVHKRQGNATRSRQINRTAAAGAKGRKDSASSGLERRMTAKFGRVSADQTISNDSNLQMVDETPVKNSFGKIVDLDFSPSLQITSQTPQPPDTSNQFQDSGSPRLSKSPKRVTR